MTMKKEFVRNDRLRRARGERDWTQKQLAEKLGVGERTIRSWESGERSPFRPLRHSLCDLFGMTAAELGIENDETEQPPQEEAQTIGTPKEVQITSTTEEEVLFVVFSITPLLYTKKKESNTHED